MESNWYRKFPQKLMAWVGACSKGLLPLVIFENGTVDHNRYINEVLPVALKHGNRILDLPTKWCQTTLP